MTKTPYYFRSPEHQYPMTSHPEYWFFVGRSDSEQAIVGLIRRNLAVLRFSASGDLLGQLEVVRSLDDFQRLAGSRPLSEDGLRELVEVEVDRYRREHHLEDEMVSVKRFRFPDLNVGVDDLPEEIQEVVQDPDRFSPSDRADLEDTLQAWKADDLYVFWWSQSFNVDADGLVTAS